MTTARGFRITLFGSAILAAALGGAVFGGPAGLQAGRTSAVVDFSRVLNAHKDLAAQQEGLEKLFRESQDQLDGLKEELEQLRAEAAVYAKGSKERFLKELALDRKKNEFEFKGRELQFELEARKAEILKNACVEIEQAVARYCGEHGVELVLAKPVSFEKFKTNDPAEVLKWLGEAEVVWAHDELDITDAIITIVNG